MIARMGKRELLAQALDKSGCNSLLTRASTWHGLLVMNYHRIGDPAGSSFDWDIWSASAEAFDRQVRFLKQHFEVIGIDELSSIAAQRPLRGDRLAMITFDDGYRDNYELAFPILKSLNAKGVFFIATGFLDNPHMAWWDEIAWMVRNSPASQIPSTEWTPQAIEFDDPDRQDTIHRLLTIYKSLPGDETAAYLDGLAAVTQSGRCPQSVAAEAWMNWDMIREMRAGGMSIGAHTVSHPILANLEAASQEREIVGSKQRIEVELGETIDSLSYPVGGRNAFNETTRELLKGNGIRWAFSYYGGYSRLDEFDPYDIPRVPVETDLSMPQFRAIAALPQIFS